VDVQFSEAALPPIYSALRVTSEGFTVPQPLDVILEVEQQLGEGRVRCVAMEPTEGMVRGMKARGSRRPHNRAGRPWDAWPRAQRHRQPGGQAWPCAV